MRLGGVIVNDVPKIHCPHPTTNDHCILFPNSDLTIPLQLIDTFSFFHSRLPDVQELYDCDKVFITPDSSDRNPHCTSFERNERAMLNYEGEMVSDDRRLSLPMDGDDDAHDVFTASSVDCDVFDSHIDAVISSAFVAPDEVLHGRGEISKFAATIGSCTVSEECCSLFESDDMQLTVNGLLDPDFLHNVQSELASLQAGKPVGVNDVHLSKLWLISEPLAQSAINQNTQLCCHNADNTLSRQFSTNDRILRY